MNYTSCNFKTILLPLFRIPRTYSYNISARYNTIISPVIYKEVSYSTVYRVLCKIQILPIA